MAASWACGSEGIVEAWRRRWKRQSGRWGCEPWGGCCCGGGTRSRVCGASPGVIAAEASSTNRRAWPELPGSSGGGAAGGFEQNYKVLWNERRKKSSQRALGREEDGEKENTEGAA
jgi:hypothetical protein